MSGIERGGQLRFLTLTSSNLSPDTCQKSWHTLIQRLRRRNLVRGYIKVPEASKNGKQHLHVLFRGDYLDQKMVSDWWTDIHHASVVDIRKTKQGSGKRHLASYMAKYMSKENIYRYSWDWGWVWKGFCKDWKDLKKWADTSVQAMKEGFLPYVLSRWQAWLHDAWKPPWKTAELGGVT